MDYTLPRALRVVLAFPESRASLRPETAMAIRCLLRADGLPLNVDADMIGGLAKGPAGRNIQTGGHSIGAHELNGGRVSLRVNQIACRDGSAQPLDFVLPL